MNNVLQAAFGWESYPLVLTKDAVLWRLDWGAAWDVSIPEYRDPTTRLLDNVVNVLYNTEIIAALRSNGELWIWDRNIFWTALSEGDKGVDLINGMFYHVENLDTQEDIDLAEGLANMLVNFPDQRYLIIFLTNVRYVALGQNILAIKDDDSLWVWGTNNYGQVGDGTTTTRTVPIQILENVRTVVGGYGHNFAIKHDETLWGWGVNDYGQLGNGTTMNSYIPVQIMENVRHVSSTYSTTMAILNDNSLWAWGSNQFGHLGDGTIIDSHVPIYVMDNVIYAVAGVSGGPLYSLPSMAITSDNTLWSWGINQAGQVGDGTFQDRLTPVRIMDNVVFIASSEFNNVAVQADGSLWVWGGIFSFHVRPHFNTSMAHPTPVRFMYGIRLIYTDNEND